jgi:RNA polymerase sigma factor (sigma-70 family)
MSILNNSGGIIGRQMELLFLFLEQVLSKVILSPVNAQFLCAFNMSGFYYLNMTTDRELLQQYAATNSEDAFAELVRRHINLVYSAALRQVNGDAHLAQDVAQTVLTSLARQADSLSRRNSVTGWLYTSAHFAAAKIIRGESRRRDREEKFMRETLFENAPEADWARIRPALDAAMHELKDADREAILLRYFENRQFAEVGAKLGLNENSARMRVERALEKLQVILTKRGVTTASALGAAISANAVQLAPAGLAASLTTASLTAAGTGTFTLLKIMTATKLQLTLGTLVVAGAATALVAQHQTQNKLAGENQALREQLAQLQADNMSLSNRVAGPGSTSSLSDDEHNELLKLRGEVGVLRRQANEVQAAGDQKVHTAEQTLADASTAIDRFKGNESATVNAMKQVGLAIRIYENSHDSQFPTNIVQLKEELPDTNEISGIDLYSFEFIDNGPAQFEHPNMVELRERLARQAPDGTWSRIYGLTDGSVQTATSFDGNFDAWEKVNTYVAPVNQ